jgi:hypothetical protein
MAEMGPLEGKGWLKWIACELELWLAVVWLLLPFALGVMVCIVVKVVVRDRTDGAGDEKVLSPPRRPVTVRVVVASEDSP